MIFAVIVLVFTVGFQFIVIISLLAERTAFMIGREKEMEMFKMDSKLYDVLKWCAALFLPALAVLVKTVFAVWGLPYGDQISTTIMAVDAFLGAILGISHIQYQKGEDNGNS